MAAHEPRIRVGWPCPVCEGAGKLAQEHRPRELERGSCPACLGTGFRREEWVPMSKLKHLLDDA